MEENIVERKKRLEMEHSLLEKAEMDLERRRHELSAETNNLLKSKLSEFSQNQPSSSSPSSPSSSIHTNSDSFHPSLFSSAHQIPPPLPPLPPSLSSSSLSYDNNVNKKSIDSEQNNNNNNRVINNQNDNQSKNDDNNSTTSPFVSVASFSSNQTTLKQPFMDNSTLSLPQEPWAFEDNDDDYDDENNTNDINSNNSNNNNMKFPHTVNQIDDHQSEISWNTLSSQQQNTSILNDDDDDDDNLSNFSLRTPAAPSEDGASSYDMLNGSDIDSHH